MPRVTLDTEWEFKGAASFITWSDDGAKVISITDYEGLLNVQDSTGRIEQQTNLPHPWTKHWVVSAHGVIIGGNTSRDTIFSVFDLVTGKLIHEEPNPAPELPGKAAAGVRLALSSDRSMLAVGFGFPSPTKVITLYATSDWHKLRSFDLGSQIPSDNPSGISRMAFSSDGSRLALATFRDIVVIDVRIGTIIARIPGSASDFAFSPDGSMLAVKPRQLSEREQTMMLRAIRVLRVADGTEVASRTYPAALSPDSILWDSRSRFLVFFDTVESVRIWNPFAGSPEDAMIRLRPLPGGMALSPDGSRLAIANSGLKTFLGGLSHFISVFRIDE